MPDMVLVPVDVMSAVGVNVAVKVIVQAYGVDDDETPLQHPKKPPTVVQY